MKSRRCAHCGEPASESWNLRPCALGRWRKFWLCSRCDIELNELVLRFVNAKDGEALLERYRERVA